MKKRSFKNLMLVLTVGMVLGMAGCGVSEPSENGGSAEASSTEVTASVDNADTGTEGTTNTTGQETSSDPAAPVISDHMKSLLGDWEMVAAVDETYFYESNQLEETADISFFVEDGKVKADYYSVSYGETCIYGAVLTEKNGKAAENIDINWYAEFGRRGRGEDDVKYYKVNAQGDVLHLIQHSEYQYEDYETGEMKTEEYDWCYIFVKEGTENVSEILDSYRYTETVTVSNVKELYNAIGSRKHIIVKGGVYNFSQLSESDKTNPYINYSGYYDDDIEEYVEYKIEAPAVYMTDLSNIFIEGEEGAEVLIVTEDPSESPFTIGGCGGIRMKNLTLGHEVEPGYCSGAVVSIYDCSNLTFEDCKLFGSGTYGFEASSSHRVDVINCDIYECTYGLLYLASCSRWDITNCTLRDSSGFEMMDLHDSWDMYFTDCEIKNNTCGQYGDYLISANQYDSIIFEKCTFKNNVYKELYAGGITFNDCVIE